MKNCSVKQKGMRISNTRIFTHGSILFILLWTAGGCSGNFLLTDNNSRNNIASGTDYTSFTYDGAWCWFSDPRAVYNEGEHRRTYAGWISSSGDIEVGFYDHDTGKIKTEVIISDFPADDHNNPSILIKHDGKLLVFYSEHATEKPMYLRRSTNPEDISMWEPVEKLNLNNSKRYQGFSDTYTYTNPIYLKDEQKLYLFWRGSDFKPQYAFSEDWGKSWSRGEILILPDRTYRNRRPYLKVASNGKDEIHFAFSQGHPRREPDNSIYYMSYKDGAYWHADGTKITDTLSKPSEVDLVYDATNSPRAWVWDVAVDQSGKPAIVYATFPDDTTHIYHYAKWNGSSWQNYKLVDSGLWFPDTPEGEQEPEPNYSGGISLDHENPNIVYLSRQRRGVFEIEKWVTRAGGKTWERNIVTSGSSFDNVRPVAVRNAEQGNSLQFLWMLNEEYIHYTDYNSVIKMNLTGR